jgi:hypothetical protein
VRSPGRDEAPGVPGRLLVGFNRIKDRSCRDVPSANGTFEVEKGSVVKKIIVLELWPNGLTKTKREIQRSLNLTLAVREQVTQAESNSSKQNQNQQNNDDETKATPAIVTGAVERPAADAAEATEQSDDKNDENDGSD